MSLELISAIATGLFGSSILLLAASLIVYKKIRFLKTAYSFDGPVPLLLPHLYADNHKKHFQPSILITSQQAGIPTELPENPDPVSTANPEPAEMRNEIIYKSLSLTNRMQIVKVNKTSGGQND